MNKKYFNLNKGIILVNGAYRGLIHNFNNKKLYSIDHDTKTYLNRLINGSNIEEALIDLKGADKKRFIEYLFLLQKNNLGTFSETKKSVEKIQKQEYKNIDTVWLELRRACNLNCCHCYLDSNYDSDKNLKKLTLNEWESVIMELCNYNVKKIILIGGEPLLFREIDELIVFIRKKLPQAILVLYSNLTLLDDKMIELLKANNVKVNTSVYSYSNKVHDEITRRNGSFDKTIEAIKKLKQNDIYVKANIAIMKNNYEIREEIIKFVYSLTDVKPKCDIIRDVGNSKLNLFIESDKHIQKPKFKFCSKEDFIRNLSGNSCWQGKINITCDGFVSPCIMGNKYIDYNYNVREKSIKDIIENYVKKEFWNVSMDYVKVCKDCEYRYACSDCRPVCEEKTQKSNRCTYDPYSGKWKETI